MSPLRAVGLLAAFLDKSLIFKLRQLVLFKHPFKIVSSPNIVKISSSVSTTPRTPPELGYRDCAGQSAGSGAAVAGRASTLQPTAEFSKLWGNIYTEAGFR